MSRRDIFKMLAVCLASVIGVAAWIAGIELLAWWVHT